MPTIMQIDDAAIRATSLICDDAPTLAWRQKKKKQRLTAVNTNNIFFYYILPDLNQRLM